MREYLQFYINGAWVDPIGSQHLDVINPSNGLPSGRIALGGAADVDRAVAAARQAFTQWSQSTRDQRLDLLKAILAEYTRRQTELGDAITEEMGAPKALAQGFHVGLGAGHLATAIELLESFAFEEQRGATLVTKEPIGVCGMITPWNWPMNQTCVKIVPALATGCTIVLKPSENSPYSAQILAEILHDAGVPAGVFNMVQGTGIGVGRAIASHPDVDLISFTGSEAVGIEIAKTAADSVKRVCQELGGKSAHIILDDEDLVANVSAAASGMMVNSGQTCSAGSRLLLPASRLEEALAAAKGAVESVTVGDPTSDAMMGPVVSERQYRNIQNHIQNALDQGHRLVTGGVGLPDGLTTGFYVKPTIFFTDNQADIARAEVFGPVLVIIAYDDIDHAVSIANDSSFGLAAYVNGRDLALCQAIARRMRVGWVSINNAFDFQAPFGGFRKSGNGREWGEAGFHEYLETRALLGFAV